MLAGLVEDVRVCICNYSEPRSSELGRPRPRTHRSDAGGGLAAVVVDRSRPSHRMWVGADDLRLVSRNVGSVANNVGRGAALVSINLGRNPP